MINFIIIIIYQLIYLFICLFIYLLILLCFFWTESKWDLWKWKEIDRGKCSTISPSSLVNKVFIIWQKQNPFLPVRGAHGSQSQPYCDNGMITLKVLIKSVYTCHKNIISRWLCRDVFMPVSNITCFPRTLDFRWLTSSGLKRTTFRSIACRQVILQPFQDNLAFMRPWCFSFVYHTALTKIQGL